LKIVFGYISALYWPINAKFGTEVKDHMHIGHIGHVTKTAIFANLRWRSAAILKIALSPYLSCELSDFNQIWDTDTNFHSENENLKKKIEIFEIQDGGQTPY